MIRKSLREKLLKSHEILCRFKNAYEALNTELDFEIAKAKNKSRAGRIDFQQDLRNSLQRIQNFQPRI